MADEWLTLKQALSQIMRGEWDKLDGEQQQSARDRLAELARNSAVELRGNISGREFERIPPNRFLKPHNFDVERHAVVWVIPDTQTFPDAMPVPSPRSFSTLNPGGINFGAFDAQGNLKDVVYRAVVQCVMVNAAQLHDDIHQPGIAASQEAKPVSDKELHTEFQKFCTEYERSNHRAPGRDPTIFWGKEKFGSRVTHDRLKKLVREDANKKPRRAGRPGNSGSK